MKKYLNNDLEKWDEMQMGFFFGKDSVDAIFFGVTDDRKYELASKKLYMVFVDLGKAFGCGNVVGSRKKRHCGNGGKRNYENVQ